MSATAQPQTDDTLTAKQRRILRHLRQQTDGVSYFKSRLIGEALGLSAKEVGANMSAVQAASGLSIERWGYSSGTTWRVAAD